MRNHLNRQNSAYFALLTWSPQELLLCVQLSFTAAEVCQCHPCFYVTRQFFLEHLLPILGRRGICLLHKNNLLEATPGIQKIWDAVKQPKCCICTSINPINSAFSNFMFERQKECKLDSYPFLIFFPNSTTTHLPSLLFFPLPLLPRDLFRLVARQPAQICTV